MYSIKAKAQLNSSPSESWAKIGHARHHNPWVAGRREVSLCQRVTGRSSQVAPVADLFLFFVFYSILSSKSFQQGLILLVDTLSPFRCHNNPPTWMDKGLKVWPIPSISQLWVIFTPLCQEASRASSWIATSSLARQSEQSAKAM